MIVHSRERRPNVSPTSPPLLVGRGKQALRRCAIDFLERGSTGGDGPALMKTGPGEVKDGKGHSRHARIEPNGPVERSGVPVLDRELDRERSVARPDHRMPAHLIEDARDHAAVSYPGRPHKPLVKGHLTSRDPVSVGDAQRWRHRIALTNQGATVHVALDVMGVGPVCPSRARRFLRAGQERGGRPHQSFRTRERITIHLRSDAALREHSNGTGEGPTRSPLPRHHLGSSPVWWLLRHQSSNQPVSTGKTAPWMDRAASLPQTATSDATSIDRRCPEMVGKTDTERLIPAAEGISQGCIRKGAQPLLRTRPFRFGDMMLPRRLMLCAPLGIGARAHASACGGACPKGVGEGRG